MSAGRPRGRCVWAGSGDRDYFVDGERPFHHGSLQRRSPAKLRNAGEVTRRRQRLLSDLRRTNGQQLRGFAALLDPDRVFQTISKEAGNDASRGRANRLLAARIA